ncbi:hypothetical protein Q5424_25905 [Conexibacter sp. JD483]|uniref:baeRF11 domain-containing protein n=1 Tax=unclassified Conexibacter TaxID=2627773 RepID=UPI002728C51D|nr:MULTISPECIES: hypothetical protein [unclassified Conexibacter]MDO8187788.1 hypothetical protein [Conexibacter sp. CPCC 205706]MDO8201976.1 hypothetical protein [Conexibacter sp. CPCC 205762]MDR9372560.1 hypothetical protein [Conexibacter sp. JD483]
MATLHTDIPSRAEVERLLDVRDADDACVSIYVATSPVTQEAEASRIEFKNLAADAVGQVEAAGANHRIVSELRETLEELHDDDGFWAEQARSLAVFAAPGRLRTFRLPNRLTDAVEVGDRFYVKPLLRTLTFPQTAFVLALAAGGARLVEVTNDGPAFTVPVPDMPSDAASAAGKASIGDRSQIGRMQGSEGQKVRLRQYAHKVDQALRHVLTGLELPLILAATEPIAAIYRSLCTYPHLVEQTLPGNPQEQSDEQLAAAARTVLDELYAAQLDALRATFALDASRERATADLAEVARAATVGAVATAVVDVDAKVPGTVDASSGVVTPDPADDARSYGVVDEIARRVLRDGGRVLAVRAEEVPGGGPVAALLRYPLGG